MTSLIQISGGTIVVLFVILAFFLHGKLLVTTIERFIIPKTVSETLEESETEPEESNVDHNLESDDPILSFFVGLPFLTMQLFAIGVLRVFRPEIILGYILVTSIAIFIYLYRDLIEFFKPMVAKDFAREHRFLVLGMGIFSAFSAIFVLRPAIQFDTLWYHLTIPKMFLQQGNIDYLGVLTRYSVHPYQNFFWNAIFQSLPVPTVIAGILINIFQFLVVAIALIYVVNFGKKQLDWSPLTVVLAPTLMGLNVQSLWGFGSGYNDMYALGAGLVASVYVFRITRQDQIKTNQLITAGVLIISLFLLKIFFGIFALVLFMALMARYNHFDLGKNSLPKFIRFGTIFVTLFLIFILPWIIRSYYFTGRLLDPIGMPGLEEDVYNFATSKTAANHWSKFVFERFYDNIFPILIFSYSPIILFGVVAVFFEKVRQKFLDLWFLGVIGFISVYFISIVFETRYLLPSVGVISLLGVIVIDIILKQTRINLFYRLSVALTPILGVLFVFYGFMVSNNELYRNLFLLKHQSLETFMHRQVSSNAFAYYKSKYNPVPKSLTTSETIFVGNVNNRALIDNPILEPTLNKEVFQSVKTAADLTRVLKSRKVKFILLKGVDMVGLCEYLKLSNPQECQIKNSPYWELDTQDDYSAVTWLKLK